METTFERLVTGQNLSRVLLVLVNACQAGIRQAGRWGIFPGISNTLA